MVAPDDSIEVNALDLLASPALGDFVHINDISDSNNSFKIIIQTLIELYSTLSATVTTKSIALGSNTITGTTAQFNTALTDGSFATLAGTEIFTNKTYDESATGNVLKIRRGIQMVLFDFTTDVATGDGKFFFHIDPSLDGNDLIDVHAEVITAGTTGTTDIQINNVTQAADMLSTKLTIDSAETGSDTAATPAVIDTANDDVAENDLIRIDVDAISTTAPKGLIITLGFRTP